MKMFKPFLIAVSILPPSLAISQGLVPSLNSEYEFCQDRPPQPAWIDSSHVRESYKGLLVQSIYRFEGYERAAEARDCSCETLFPPWTNAVQHYNDNYLHLEQFEAMQTRRDFQQRGSALRQSVRELCEAEGNW